MAHLNTEQFGKLYYIQQCINRQTEIKCTKYTHRKPDAKQLLQNFRI